MIESKTNVAIPPGYTIKEQLKIKGFSQKEFAERMELSEKHISKLLNGEVLLTFDVAFRLEMVLGIPAQVWNNLEALYRNDIIQIELENNIDEEVEPLSRFPYNEMAKLGFVPATKNKLEKVINLKKYFEVNNLDLITNNKDLNILCRKLSNKEKTNFALIAWAQQAKLLARDMETKPINIKKLIKNINLIRNLTVKPLDEFLPILQEILKDCGIALVILPTLAGSYLHGATFIDNKKIVLAVSTRSKTSDKFWFSLFHELGHIVLEHIYKDYNDEFENEANLFAQNTLVSIKDYEWLLMMPLSITNILDFCLKINIDPAIVIARLQKDKVIGYNEFNDLKRKFE